MSEAQVGDAVDQEESALDGSKENEQGEEEDFLEMLDQASISLEELEEVEEENKEQKESEEQEDVEAEEEVKVSPKSPTITYTEDDHDKMEMDFGQFMLYRKPERISGDFKVREETSVSNLQDTIVISSIGSEDLSQTKYESEEEEEEEEEIEDEREPKMDRYMQLMDERRRMLHKNIILHRFLNKYFYRRRLVKYLIESDEQGLKIKYERLLMQLSRRLIFNQKKREQQIEFTRRVKAQMEEDYETLDQLTASFIKEERDLALASLHTRSGKTISEKQIHHIINLQMKRLEEIAELRLCCIRIRNQVAAKEAKLKGVETLGNNLRLVDYEQLRLENLNYTERIEERNDDLLQLREKCSNHIQIVAHTREKSYYYGTKIRSINNRLEELDEELSKAREELNELKLERDGIRIATNKIREKSGLLMETRLLHDFQATKELVKQERENLQKVRASYEQDKRDYTVIRAYLDKHNKSGGDVSHLKPTAYPKKKNLRNVFYTPEIEHRNTSGVIKDAIK